MKNFATILFLTIIGLSVTSQAWERTGEDMFQICQSDSGCDDGCCSDCCSPFHICNTCHGFTVSELLADNTNSTCRDFNLSFYTQPHCSLFCGDIWQPPKIG